MSANRADEPFGYCFNTSTIRGQKLTIEQEIEIVAKAGYQGIEPWISELDRYVEGGGKLADLGKRIADAGLKVASAIGFADWIVDDDDARRRGFETAKRDMEKVRAIGGSRIAAPPHGATQRDDMDLRKIADRYRQLLKLGDEMGVVPQLEVWGFSKTLQKLSDAVWVVVEAGHPSACLLPDVYHLYKGGSSFPGLRALSGLAVHVFHVNDYPADPPREMIADKHRVYPGDGVAPLNSIFRDLRDAGFRGMLSLELFNESYWSQDPLVVARAGLEKTKAAVRSALS